MSKLLRTQGGFTLVELMVVVAIIGVLSAIAVPNFKKYQAKSKTSEAKLQLSAAYTAQQSFYSDMDTYHVCLSYMGYNPTAEAEQRFYRVGFASGTAACANCETTGEQNGLDIVACPTTYADGRTAFPGEKTVRTGVAVAADTDMPTTAITESTFTMGAAGVIDAAFATTTSSAFTITENKLITQRRTGF